MCTSEFYTPVEKGQSFAINTFVIRKLKKKAKKRRGKQTS